MKMACGGHTFDPKDRSQYRHPPAPLGFQNPNPPGLQLVEDTRKYKYDFDKWAIYGIFDEPDVTKYDGGFVLNTDSEEEDIVEIPFIPIAKNIEEICIDDDDDDNLPVPVVNIKKEKEESKTENKDKNEENTNKIEPSKVEKTKKDQVAEKIQVIVSRSNTDDKVKRKEVTSAEPRISKKPQDKAPEERPTEKHRDKKTKKDDEGNRHKKDRSKTEPVVDKSVRPKTKLSSPRYYDSDIEVEDEERRKHRPKKKHRSPSPKKHHSPSPKKHRSPSPKKHRSPSPRKYRTPSPPPRDDYKRDYSYFKQEGDDYYTPTSVKQEFPSVAGVYHCDICNLTLNSAITFKTHIEGKRHKKNQDAKNVAQAVAKSYVPIKPTSKCPNPPPGFKRIDIHHPAKIQNVVDDKLKTPCPALHKVIEIQSLPETSYYCTLCDAPCSANSILPHLSGFKHQLSCLKYYDIELYDEISYKQKYQIENLVLKKLREFERIHGRGLLKVQMDIQDNGSYDPTNIPSTSSLLPAPSSKPSTSSRSRPSSRDQPGSSREGGSDFMQLYQEYSQPDPDKAGFYCRLCLSHSNSEMMWKAHINGKRHLANLKKAPGTAPSKSRNVPAPPGTIPRLWDLLEDVEEPIVGLDQIREIQRLDIDSVSYTCFLCGGISICDVEIVDHILLTKHREKYLEKIRFPDLETLRSVPMSEHSLGSLIAEMCERVENEMGRGEPEVYYAKNSLVKL